MPWRPAVRSAHVMAACWAAARRPATDWLPPEWALRASTRARTTAATSRGSVPSLPRIPLEAPPARRSQASSTIVPCFPLHDPIPDPTSCGRPWPRPSAHGEPVVVSRGADDTWRVAAEPRTPASRASDEPCSIAGHSLRPGGFSPRPDLRWRLEAGPGAQAGPVLPLPNEWAGDGSAGSAVACGRDGFLLVFRLARGGLVGSRAESGALVVMRVRALRCEREPTGSRRPAWHVRRPAFRRRRAPQDRQ